MRKILFAIAFLAAATWCATVKKLVWSDEFDYTGLPDPNKWGYDIGGNGWGNNELEYYTGSRAKNAKVDSGQLKITVLLEDTTVARNGTSTTNHFTSARLVTRGLAAWTYGRFEARMKMPKGLGMWPAFWLIPTRPNPYGGWPASGEIDVVENWGYDPSSMRGSVQTANHSGGSSIWYQTTAAAPSDSFHVYSLDWSPDTVAVSLDGKPYFRYLNPHTNSSDWPFDQPFYVILNVAVSGTWGDTTKTQTGNLPQSLVVDWVRVWQDSSASNASIVPNSNTRSLHALRAYTTHGNLFLVTDRAVRWILRSSAGTRIRSGSLQGPGIHALGPVDSGVGYLSVTTERSRRTFKIAVP